MTDDDKSGTGNYGEVVIIKPDQPIDKNDPDTWSM